MPSSRDIVMSDGGMGLLFDTFVPVSSILTISIVVGFTLPQHELFGLFWLMCWLVAVFVSLQSVTERESETQQKDGISTDGLFSVDDRIGGVCLFCGLPIVILLSLWLWWKQIKIGPQNSNQPTMLRRIRPIRGFVLNRVPVWSMVAIHTYRMDALSIMLPFWNGGVPNFVGYQTIVLDAIIGVTAIPLTWLLYVRIKRRGLRSRFMFDVWAPQKQTRRYNVLLWDCLWFWNSLGLYDLCSAYLVFVLNVFGLGGPHIAEPPLLPRLGRHPLPLLILFQVPLAIASHILMLTNMDNLIHSYEQQRKESKDRQLGLPTTVSLT